TPATTSAVPHRIRFAPPCSAAGTCSPAVDSRIGAGVCPLRTGDAHVVAQTSPALRLRMVLSINRAVCGTAAALVDPHAARSGSRIAWTGNTSRSCSRNALRFRPGRGGRLPARPATPALDARPAGLLVPGTPGLPVLARLLGRYARRHCLRRRPGLESRAALSWGSEE